MEALLCRAGYCVSALISRVYDWLDPAGSAAFVLGISSTSVLSGPLPAVRIETPYTRHQPMNPPHEDNKGSKQTAAKLKARVAEEFKLFWVIAIYLTVMLGAFTWYKRFILSASGIGYFHYGAAVVEALILSKVILIGRALGLGKRSENTPLALSALFKALEYGVLAGLFFLVEHLIGGFVHHKTWDEIMRSLVSHGYGEILAQTVMVIVSFIPFFAFWEMHRVLGEGRLFALFFHRRAPQLEG